MKIRKIVVVFIGCALLIGAIILGIGYGYFTMRGHGNVEGSVAEFRESAKKLSNPNRGFYRINGFRIHDTEMDFAKEIEDRYCEDEDTTLTMVQVNLEDFREGCISNQGMNNIKNLFENLGKTDKEWIVRFLYDWAGQCEGKEPDDLNIILKHMEQVGPVVNQYANRIFTLQGLFVGNWGEMNGTPYIRREDVERLANQLGDCTSKDVFLAVRMPMFWRMITGTANPMDVEKGRGRLMDRLGLYNDGILGNDTDYGTYGHHTQKEHGDFTYWSREEEIPFQDILCQKVPQGGEVIVDNPCNDFENAVNDLRKMHVTYLNQDYDRNVLNKWKSYTVQEEGCFHGMDGLSYIERHLGYRLYIEKTKMDYHFFKDEMSIQITMKNSGFAPLYKETEMEMVLRDTDTGQMHYYPMDGTGVMELSGSDAEQSVCVSQTLSFMGDAAKTYEVYISIRDCASGKWIELANEQEITEYGYRIGSIQLLDTAFQRYVVE